MTEKVRDRAKGEMSLGQNALVFVLAGVIAASVGVFRGLQAEPSAPPRASAGAKAKEGQNEAPIAEMGTLDLPPVVTNLAAPSNVWVRIEGTLLFRGKTLPDGKALAAKISGDLLAYMRTQTLTEIQGAAGLQHLRQDLTDRVVTRSEGRVKAFIIRSLVVQ